MIRLMPVTVATVSPLTVTFPDGSTHAAMGIVGTSYTAGSGIYAAIFQQGQPPIVLPLGTTGGTDNVIDGNA